MSLPLRRCLESIRGLSWPKIKKSEIWKIWVTLVCMVNIATNIDLLAQMLNGLLYHPQFFSNYQHQWSVCRAAILHSAVQEFRLQSDQIKSGLDLVAVLIWNKMQWVISRLFWAFFGLQQCWCLQPIYIC